MDDFSKKKWLFSEKPVSSSLFQIIVYVTECIDSEKAIQGETVAPQIISAYDQCYLVNEQQQRKLEMSQILCKLPKEAVKKIVNLKSFVSSRGHAKFFCKFKLLR